MQRNDKARRNEPCPCGSGKKFKKCHVQNEEHRQLQGNDAKTAILERLSRRPKAQSLAAEVCDFYGSYLQYQEDVALESSDYTLKLRHEPLSLEYARIQLQLGTERHAEALTHELLHLNMPMRGFLMGEAVSIPDELDQYARDLMDLHPKIGNLVDHDINVDLFVALGFSREDFLGLAAVSPNYEQLASKASPAEGYVREVGFPWWCLEYLRHWISIRHGVENGSLGYAQSALRWGSVVHPELTEAANRMREIIESGLLKDPRHYPEQLNALLDVMRVPKYTAWVAINSCGESGPVAIRVNVKDGDLTP